MNKFYICTTAIAKGPYRLHEIDTLNIGPNDLIWSDDLQQSRRAAELPEFRDYLKKKLSGNVTIGKTGKSLQVKKIILILLLCALGMLIAYYFTMP